MQGLEILRKPTDITLRKWSDVQRQTEHGRVLVLG